MAGSRVGLPRRIRERLRRLKERLGAVEGTPFSVALDNFSTDADPSAELRVWQAVADGLDEYRSEQPAATLAEQRDALLLFLTISVETLPADSRSHAEFVVGQDAFRLADVIRRSHPIAYHERLGPLSLASAHLRRELRSYLRRIKDLIRRSDGAALRAEFCGFSLRELLSFASRGEFSARERGALMDAIRALVIHPSALRG